jgi:vitamin B12 transporter
MLTERNFPNGDGVLRSCAVGLVLARESGRRRRGDAVVDSRGVIVGTQALRLVCAVSLCLYFAAARVLAETEAAANVDTNVDELVVVATRSPQPISQVGNSVTVLDDADIKASQATVASDLLARVPGLSVARNGGVGQPTSVFIRGAESDQTVVLIDGVQLNDPSTTTGGFDFENLLLGNISRIEILRGAQSTLYGSQAMGGVINITTADPTSPAGGAVNVEGGSHDTDAAAGNIGGQSGNALWRLSGDWNSTHGIPAFDERYGGKRDCDSKIGGGSGQFRYDVTPDLQADLRGYYVDARTEFDGYDTPTGTFGDDNEYGRTSQTLAYAGLTLRSPDRTLTNRLAYQYTRSETREYDPDAPVSYFSPSIETFFGIGQNQREEYQGTWDITPHYQLVLGAQHERSSIDSDTPAFDYSGPAPIDAEATIDSGYAQLHGVIAPGLSLTAGERYDRHDQFGGHSTGALAAAWALNDDTTLLRASFAQGFKAPSLYQLFSPYGSTRLHPEFAETWDAGVEQHEWNDRLVLSATYFERYSRDLIEFIDCLSLSDCPNDFGGFYANVPRAAAHGVELQAAATPMEQLQLTANYTFTHTEDKSPGATFGNELARRPENTANLSGTYIWTAAFNTNVTLRYSGPSYDDAANQTKLGGYVLTDLRAAYTVVERLEVYARIENLADKHYETAYRYGELGRVAYVGLRANF